jgi:hypothetical protein
VGPNATGELFLHGSTVTGITISGNAGTNTSTVAGIASSTTQVGTVALATNVQAAAQAATTVALTPSNATSLFSTNALPATQGGTGLKSPTAHSLIVAEGGSAFNVLGVASNGQIPIGSAGADPVLATLTAGTNVSITNGAGSISIAASTQAVVWNYTATAVTPYTVAATDNYISADTTGGAFSVQLPNAPTTGRIFTVKDGKGDAGTNHLTVTTVGGAVNIDGATTYVISTNYGSAQFIFNGTSYEVF